MTEELRELTKIKPYENNPKKHEVERIIASFQIGLPENLTDAERRQYIVDKLIDQPIVVDGQGVIIKGHGRLKAAKALGLTHFPVKEQINLSPEEVRLARLADNRSGESGYEPDLLSAEMQDLQALFPADNLNLLGMNADWFKDLDLSELLEKKNQENQGWRKIDFQDTVQLASKTEEALVNAERVAFAFSGGKDSTCAVMALLPYLQNLKKPVELLFVQTGVEIPDIPDYVIKVAKLFDLPLHILRPRKDFIQYYDSKGAWPSAIYRDCIDNFINDPQDAYNFALQDEFVLVRGGAGRTENQTIQV